MTEQEQAALADSVVDEVLASLEDVFGDPPETVANAKVDRIALALRSSFLAAVRKNLENDRERPSPAGPTSAVAKAVHESIADAVTKGWRFVDDDSTIRKSETRWRFAKNWTS